MTYVIIALFVIALLHFVYESILAPSFRLDLRFKLFKLRDEVRWLKIEHRNDLNDKHFQYLHDSINTAIQFLSRIDFATLAASDYEYKHNEEFRKRVEARREILDDCSLEEARSIRRRSCIVVGEALVVNMGGWLFYLAPFVALGAVGMVCISATSKVRTWFARRIKLWMAVPEPDLERLTHSVVTMEFAN